MASNEREGTTVAPQRDEERADGSGMDLAGDEAERSNEVTVFRDCRGELVWFD